MHNQLLLRRLRTYRCAIDRDKILNVPTIVPSLGICAPGSARCPEIVGDSRRYRKGSLPNNWVAVAARSLSKTDSSKL